MTKLYMYGLLLLAAAGTTLKSAEGPIKPIAYFLENISAEESADDALKARTSFIRDGKEYEAFEGAEIYPGDVIKTGATGGISIAFLDSTAVRLHEATEFKLGNAPVPAGKAGEMTLVSGRASIHSTPYNEYHWFMGLGSGTGNGLGGGLLGGSSASCLTKFDVIVTKEANGDYVSHLAVLKGSVTMTPKGGSKVDVLAGNQLVMKLISPNTVPAPPVTVTAGNLTTAEILALEAKAVTETVACVNKNGSVTFNSLVKNSDGSISLGKVTTVSGQVTKDTWKTTDANKKKITTWIEDDKRIVFSNAFMGYTLKTTIKKADGSGLATLKGPGGITYKGTVTYNSSTGLLTFTSKSPAKDGSSATFVYNPKEHSGLQQTLTITPSSGPAIVKSDSLVPIPTFMTTPDDRVFDQNQPPLSQ